jgi:hypothetical protein
MQGSPAARRLMPTGVALVIAFLAFARNGWAQG